MFDTPLPAYHKNISSAYVKVWIIKGNKLLTVLFLKSSSYKEIANQEAKSEKRLEMNQNDEIELK